MVQYTREEEYFHLPYPKTVDPHSRQERMLENYGGAIVLQLFYLEHAMIYPLASFLE